MVRTNPNRRGKDNRGRFAFRALVELEADDYPPNSKFWCNTARDLLLELEKLDKNWEVWYDKVIPDNATCKVIAELLDERILTLNDKRITNPD